MVNALSIDVEDYFHPSEVQSSSTAAWDSLPSRVDASTTRVLDLLARHQVRATFFILGWVAGKFPALVRRIAAAGHEIACHSYAHQLVYHLGPERFRADTERALQVIADACGIRPRGYRAPSYSITRNSLWALDILAELGFSYDSSIYPIAHDRYGIPGFPRAAHSIPTSAGAILEIPPAAVQLTPRRAAPVGGGGYLRLLPYAYTAAGIRRLNFVDQIPACMYFHPWEIDPASPRLATGRLARLRTYLGLAGMERKLHRLLTEFRFAPLADVFSC
jgi:polysaccharide deacetylase family protein (PEP-CTERM system associated)